MHKPALIIAGMHRSGTSMISSYLNAVGVLMGEQFLQKDKHNPKGYFEDEELLRFQQSVMQALCKGGVGGWEDWGFTEDHRRNDEVLVAFKAEALQLIEKRRSLNRVWGWKDPRSTLLLDFWAELMPEARFLLLYRNPWEVKRSVKNLQAEVFTSNPDYAFEIWNLYNHHLLDFYKRNKNHCLLVSANAFLTKPLNLIELINARFSWNLNIKAANNYSFYSGDLFYSEVCRQELNDFNSSQSVVETLDELNREADWPYDTKQLTSQNDPLVSVVIPCFNQGHYIDEAIFSVEKSRNKLYEIIIVNDGSTDIETVRRLKALEKEGYRVINQRNTGLAGARNAGIKAARAPYILPLDADNKIDPILLIEGIKILEENPEIAVVYSNCRLFGSESGMREVPEFDIVEILCQNYIDACAMIRKSALERAGGFEEGMPVLGIEDWELWIHIHKLSYKFHHINKFLFDYRVSGNSMSLNINKPENRVKNINFFFDKHRSLVNEHADEVIRRLIRKFADMEQLAWDRQSVIENLQAQISELNNAGSSKGSLQACIFIQNLRDKTKKKVTAKIYRAKDLVNKARNELKPAASNSENEKWSLYRVLKFFLSAKGRSRSKRLLKKIFKLFVKVLTGKSVGNQDYGVWLRRSSLSKSEVLEMRKQQQRLIYRPLISVIMPVYNPSLKHLKAAIQSVKDQIYDNWELCIADDFSRNDAVRDLIKSFQSDDPRIKVFFRTENGHIARCANDAIRLADGEFLAFLDHDDLLTNDALLRVVEELNKEPDLDLIYSDEDKIDEKGNLREPYFKPDWSPDSFLSRNYINHLTVVRKRIVDELQGLRDEFNGAQDYDLLLRVIERTNKIKHIPKILYHWRMHEASAALQEQAKPYAFEAGVKALDEAFNRRGIDAKASIALGLPGYYQIRYKIKERAKVSIVIPSRDQAEALKVCIDSIVGKSTYENYEIILISNNSSESLFFELVEQYRDLLGERFKFYEYNKDFNYSAIINFGVSKSEGEYILLLNNDTEVVTLDWIEAMIEHAQRRAIGAVGVKLLYNNDTIQHAGVVIGLGGVAGHTFIGKHRDDVTYYYYAQSVTNYCSVTAACLMCRRDVFDEVGGFDEQLVVEYNDVDFCLKLKELGLHNVYLPHVILYHFESLSRGHPHKDKESYDRHVREIEYFKSKWQKYIDNDPCYNPNLSKDYTDFRIAL